MVHENPRHTLVIIPAFNEEKNISAVITQVKAFGYDVLVVDDGSADKTATVAAGAGAMCFIQAVNQGKGAAIRRGIQYFLGQPSYTSLVLLDADGQHDPKELPFFLKKLRETNYDLIVGSRMTNARSMPFVRYATNTLMSGLLSFLTRQKIEDSQCGYRAMTRRVAEKIRLQTAHYEIESEMLLEAAGNGFKIGSLPIECVYRGQKSQINPLRDTARFIYFLFCYFSDKIFNVNGRP